MTVACSACELVEGIPRVQELAASGATQPSLSEVHSAETSKRPGPRDGLAVLEPMTGKSVGLFIASIFYYQQNFNYSSH